MTEKFIEQYLREGIKRLGGKAYKFVSPGNNGVPDRLICLPGGKNIFVETKAPGKVSSPLQRKKQLELAQLGNVVFSDIDSIDAADKVLGYCRWWMKTHEI